MKQIIRIEHSDGLGCFYSFNPLTNENRIAITGYKLSKFMSERHQGFPLPYEDGLKRDNDDYCAFKSIKQIQEWIKPDEFNILFKNDYKVYLIEVSEYKEGKMQCLYKKQHIIQKTDISNLFKT